MAGENYSQKFRITCLLKPKRYCKKKEKTTTVQTYDEFKSVLCNKDSVKAAWCGSADDEAKIKEETGATIRVRPFQKEEPATNCIYCGRKAKEAVYFARAY